MEKETSQHVQRKHYIKSRGKQWARELLNDCAISADEVRAFEMYYYQDKDIGYIADTIGWSYSAAQRHIAKTAKAIVVLANYRAKTV